MIESSANTKSQFSYFKKKVKELIMLSEAFNSSVNTFKVLQHLLKLITIEVHHLNVILVLDTYALRT